MLFWQSPSALAVSAIVQSSGSATAAVSGMGSPPAAAASVKGAAHSLHVEQPPAARAKAGNPPGIGFGFHPGQRQTEFARQAEGRNEILAPVHVDDFKDKAPGLSNV